MQWMMWLAAVGMVWLVVWALVYAREKRSADTDGSRASGLQLSRDLPAGGVLFLLVLAFFWRTLSGDVYQPADGGDLVSFLFPTYRFAAAQLSQGILPLWNPHLYGGAPFISDIQAGFLYPVNALLFVLQPDFDYTTMQWLAIGHLYWAGLGVYVLLRVLRPGGQPVMRMGALLAGLAFALSDALFIHLGNLNLIAVLSWMPWIFAAFVLGLDRRRRVNPGENEVMVSARREDAEISPGNLRRNALGWSVAAALLFAVANYAGHAQSSYYIALGLTVFAVAATVTNVLRARPAPFTPLLHLLVVGVLTALLTAPILLPALEMTQFTARGNFRYQDTIAFSLAPTQALVGMVTPGFFGRGPALHWGLWDRVETPFVGVTTLLLALGALFLATPRTRRDLWPWVAVALFGLIAALGVYAILHGWLTLLLPGFDQFRAPARAIVLWAFAVSVLAGVGLDQVVRAFDAGRVRDAVAQVGAGNPMSSRAGRGYARLLGVGGMLLAGIVVPLAYVALVLTQDDATLFLRASVAALALVFAASAWLATWAVVAGLRAAWIGGATASVFLLALLFFDYAGAGAYTDISPTDPTRGFQHPEIVAFLHADPDLFRMDARTDINDLWQPDAAALHGLYDVWGIANPLLLQHWERLWESTGGRQTARYDMLNVKYVLVRDGTPLPEGKFRPALDAPGELALYENLEFMPRAWLVHDVVTVAPGAFDTDDLNTLFTETGLDPWERAVVERATPLDLPGDRAAAEDLDDSVVVTAYGSSRMALDVAASAPALLVLSEVWYPGWQVRIDGMPGELLRANGALRAVPVPAGASSVELRFVPVPWRQGLMSALLGLVLAGVIVMFGRLKG